MSYFGKRHGKRIIQVPLDTSGIINFNHLDVIPMQFLNDKPYDNDSTSINISLNDVNQVEDHRSVCSKAKSKSPRVTPRKAVTIKSDRIKAPGGKSHSNLKIQKRQTRVRPFPVETTSETTYSNIKVTLSSSFDRRGRMTRVTTDYNQDSENSEYYKQMRLGRKKQTKRNERQKNILQNYLNYMDSSPGTSGVSSEEDFRRVTKIDKTQPIQYTSASISQCLNFLENYEEDRQNSTELDKLTQTLEQLQNSCNNNDFLRDLNNPRQSHTNLVNSQDIFTLCPTEPNAFKSETSITEAPSDAYEKKSVEKNIINDQSVSVLDQFQLPHYFVPDNSFEILVKGSSSGLQGRKAADIWDWVSPSYTRDASSTFSATPKTPLLKPSEEERQSKANLQITQISSRNDSFSYRDNPLTKTQSQNNGLGKLIPTVGEEALLDLRAIQSNADELPLTPRTIFAPITSAIEDMLLKRTKTQQVTPPLTSSSWSISPIYEAESVGNQQEQPKDDSDLKLLTEHISNSITGIKEELFNQAFSSSCSLAAAVSSTASMADVHSSEDIPTRCSSNSTFSDFNEHEHHTSDGLSAMSDQRIQDLLAQFHETVKQKKTMSFGKFISSIVQKEANKSGYKLEIPSTSSSSKSQTPEINFEKNPTSTNSKSMMVNEILQPQSLDPNLQNKMNEVETGAVPDGNSIAFKTYSKSPEHSKSNKSRKKEKKKGKGKKGRKDKEVNDVEEENKGKGRHRRHKYNVTQTLASEQPIQKLKSALPRTPGGRYSLEGKAAEDAIAAYVKAELAASLECADAIRNGSSSKSKMKPLYGNLGDFLRKLAAKDSKSNKGHASNPKVSVKCASAKCRVPKYALKPKPMIHERPKNIILPRQSNRMNFIRYQQQSLAAMIHYSKWRNRKKPLLDTGIKDSVKISTPNAKEYGPYGLRARRDTFNNRFRSNRNEVTVVFDKTME